MNTSEPHHAVTVYVIHQDKFLLIKRCCDLLHGTWQMVTGSVELGEKSWEAALREVKEETGITPAKFYTADAVEVFYMKATDTIGFVPVFVVVADSFDVVLCPEEHDEYEWLSYKEARARLVWNEQRRVIDLVNENFILNEPSSHWLYEKSEYEVETPV